MALSLITDTPEEELLTISDLSKKWGYKSNKAVLGFIDRGLLPCIDLTPEGNVRRTGLRVPVSAANDFIKRRTIAARTSAA